ncbi:MAG: glycoside hydrolase family 32 protein [Propionibacteriaceae bacterium]|nr:glycoside hydrolase family 32 protein [Propionibacteriaceae bacterium]
MTSREEFIDAAQRAISESRASLDPDYPRFHVAPPVGRLNDPNGLVVIDGVYHVFYQFGPFFPQEKAIYWGHATSTDLITWRTHAPAIPPSDWYDRNGVYSGGAVVRDGAVWLHYTGNVKDDQGRREAYQCAAVTTDFETFTKLDANPLISGPPAGYTAHLRDPYVVAEGDGFAMYLGSQRADNTGCILVYRSDDLLDWRLAGELVFPDDRYAAFGYMWECPNLFRLPDADTGEEFDVLIVCPQGVGPADRQFQHLPCGYPIGHLEGTRFTAGDFRTRRRLRKFYAPQVFTGSPPGTLAQAPLLMGWFRQCLRGCAAPLAGHGWVHALSVPRDHPATGGSTACHAGSPGSRPAWTLPDELPRSPHAIPELDGVRSFIVDLEIAQTDDWSLRLGKPGGAEIALASSAARSPSIAAPPKNPHGDRRRLTVPDPRQARGHRRPRPLGHGDLRGGRPHLLQPAQLSRSGWLPVAIAGRVEVIHAAATVLP